MFLIVFYDMYGINFEVDDMKLKNRVTKRTGVSAYDSSWYVVYERINDVFKGIVKVVV